MPINKRLELIGLLESLILKEDVETFIRKSNRKISPEENDIFIKNWYKNSATFTRMWLNYLSDEKLLEILEKKLSKQSINDTFNWLNSRM